VVASRARAGVWFTHGDAGGSAELYAFQLNGAYIEAHRVKDAGFRDWEDITGGDCPAGVDARDCLYIGDIGDNSRTRDDITIYAVTEPAAGEPAQTVATWTLRYPDGPEDSETLLLHPCTGRLYLVTKSHERTAQVFLVPEEPDGAADTGATSTGSASTSEPPSRELEYLAYIDLGPGKKSGGVFTGGDWNGEQLVIRGYSEAWLWETDPADPDAHWGEPGQQVHPPAHTGAEALAIADDLSLVLVHEGVPMAIGTMACLETIETEGCPTADTTTGGTSGTTTGNTSGETSTGGITSESDTGPDDSGRGGVSTPPETSEEGCGCRGAPLAALPGLAGAWVLPWLVGRRRRL